jgi:hypothetical protein
MTRSSLGKIGLGLGGIAALAALAWNYLALPTSTQWTDEEQRLIASLSLNQLPRLPADPSNAQADNPDAAELGHASVF